jgi:hypothetical protein
VDEVGVDVRLYCRALCCHTQQLLFLAIFHYSIRVHFSRTLNDLGVGAFRLIRAIDLRHHLDGECYPDSVASLMRTNTCLTANLLVSRQHGHGNRNFSD